MSVAVEEMAHLAIVERPSRPRRFDADTLEHFLYVAHDPVMRVPPEGEKRIWINAPQARAGCALSIRA